MSWSIRTVLLSGLGVVAVGALAVTAFREDPVPVDLAVIERGTLVITVDAEGETRIRDIYNISAPITGTLLRLPLEVGDIVKKGETVVAEVEPDPAPLLDARSRAEAVAVLHEASASIRFADAEVTRARADVQFAQAHFDRTQALTKTGASSLTRLEDASLKLALAEAAAVSAEARLAMAEASQERAQAVLQEPELGVNQGVCCVRLIAPATGVVLSQTDRSSRPVLAGEHLLSIGDPHDLEVVVDLLSADATRLAPGASVVLERWGGPDPLEATLRKLEPTARTIVSALGIEEQRVDALLDITSPRQRWAGLGQGFAVFARIEEWRREDVILVPLSAIFQQDGDWFTFVAVEGVAIRQQIEIGRRDGRWAIVEGGLEVGDEVVTHPPDSIADGRTITQRVRF